MLISVKVANNNMSGIRKIVQAQTKGMKPLTNEAIKAASMKNQATKQATKSTKK